MTIAARRAALLIAWSALATLPGCVPAGPGAARAVRVDAAACAREAERLLEPVVVHAAPALDAAPLEQLDGGRFVYRCGRRGEWLAVMFPASGEALDCSWRAPDRACRTGWVRGDVATEIFG